MAKRQNFVVGSTNPNTQTRTDAQLNQAWNQFEVLKSGILDGVFNAVSDYSNDSSNEIANAIVELTGSQPTGNSQTELAGALRQMREDIETTSLTFKGYISATAPSSSDYALQVGNIWIQSATLPTVFPVAIAGIWDGTSWESTTETYTQKDFDFFRNVNDNEGYYWFGGEWTVMSTDMSTSYFTLNQTSGKWEIKDSVNLPGAPTVATPTSSSPNTQIANKKYVDDAIGGSGTGRNVGDIFFTARKDNELNGAVECNGSLYNTTDFTETESIGALLEAGKIPYISLSQYNTELTNSGGTCGVFGWDGTGTTTFRVPTLQNIFVEAATGTSNLGDYLSAGLPNITGSFKANAATMYKTPKGHITETTGAFSGVEGDNSNVDGGDGGSNTFGTITLNASASSPIYGNSGTVQPRAVKYRPMVQLAIAASDTALAVCTSVLADVANLNTHRVVEFQAPSSQNNYTWYRKYADGWVEQGGEFTLTFNNEAVAYANVTFPVTMANNHYFAVSQGGYISSVAAISYDTSEKTTTTIRIQGACVDTQTATGTAETGSWRVEGLMA